MNIESVLMKVASTLNLYQPSKEEQPMIESLLQQNMIMEVIDGKRKGYHITIHGVRWRSSKFNHYQGNR
jgi:hypothetical protein